MKKLPKLKWRDNKKPLSKEALNRLDIEDIFIKAKSLWLSEIKHPTNIANWIIAWQSLNQEQVLLELWITKNEFAKEAIKVERQEPWLVGEYRIQRKKEIKEKLKDNAEDYLASIFNWTQSLDVDKKSRLALDILKATDREYNQSTSTPIQINLWELPLGDWLFEAQKKIVLELGITSDIFNNLDT
jgi:hypothetical protein